MTLGLDEKPRLVSSRESAKHSRSPRSTNIISERIYFGEFSWSNTNVSENTTEGKTVRERKRERKRKWSFFIVVPTATILGGPELYVGAGSTINLTCAIHFSSEPPAYIFWYYNENVLSYDSPRGGVSVITEKGGDVTTSWLLIQTAQTSDSGEYSCKPSNANTASIKVHVLNGECLHSAWLRSVILQFAASVAFSIVGKANRANSQGRIRQQPSVKSKSLYVFTSSSLRCIHERSCFLSIRYIYRYPFFETQDQRFSDKNGIGFYNARRYLRPGTLLPPLVWAPQNRYSRRFASQS